MRPTFATVALVSLAVTADAGRALAAEAKKLLVVTVTKGFRHESIPTLEKIVEGLGARRPISPAR
jgi:hypothetical protein